MDCNRTVELLSEYVDDALSGEARVRLEEHLAACPACAEELESLIHRHSVKPRSYRRLSVKLAYSGECFQVGVLGQIEGILLAAGHLQQQGIDPGRRLSIKLSLGFPIALPASFDQLMLGRHTRSTTRCRPASSRT